MQGEKILFNLNYERFQRILSENNWFKLQQEFKNPLSESFLIWRDVEEGGSERWLLVDLRKHSSYSISRHNEEGAVITDEDGNPVGHVSEFPALKNQLQNTSWLIKLLQTQNRYGLQGTRTGFILLLMKLNVGNVYLGCQVASLTLKMYTRTYPLFMECFVKF